MWHSSKTTSPTAPGAGLECRPRLSPCWLALLGLGLFASSPLTAQETEARIDGRQALLVLSPDIGLQQMEKRQWVQEQTRKDFGVDVDFRFSDRLEASGIEFRHRIVDDSGIVWKPVHYDHGNGLLVADYDGDETLDLLFLTQIGSNQLWRGLGDGRFENATEGSGLELADRISVTGSAADYDNDGDADLCLTTVRGGNVLLRNDGEGRFEDVTEAAGVGYSGHSSSPMFFDYDNDGHLDLLLVNVGVYTGSSTGPGGYHIGYEDAFSGHEMPHRTEKSRIFHNRGDGTFEDATEALGFDEGGWNGDATFIDLDRDGYLDIYLANMQGLDSFWHNQGGERFVERAREVFGMTPWGAMGLEFFDWDQDGDLDLYVTDMHSDMQYKVAPGYEKTKSMAKVYREAGYEGIFGNAFFENRGDGTFEEISDRIAAENYWPWGISVGDLNADGWEDVFVASSMNYPFRYGVNTVLLNDRGETFRDSELLLGVEPREGNPRTHWFELDCDEKDRRHRLCEGREGEWTVYGSRGTRTSAILDLDGDGDQDIVTSEFNDVPQVLISDLASRRPVRWLEVELEGTESNRDGLGARVRVHVGDRVLTQQNDGKSGYLSQSRMPLYFGLDDAPAATKIEVVWPSGARQEVTEGLQSGSTVRIREN